MARFGLSSLVRKSRRSSAHDHPAPSPSASYPLDTVSEEAPVQSTVSASSSYNTNSSSSLFDNDQEEAALSACSSYNNNGDSQFSPHAPIVAPPQHQQLHTLSRKPSFESSVDTLVVSDIMSSANTLSPETDTQTQTSNARQQQYAGNSRSLPIYATRFKSGVQVYESDVAAKVSRTLTRQRKQKGSSSSPSSSAASTSSTDHIPMPPSLCCQAISSYNPFSSKKTPFMTISRLGKTLRHESTGNQPKTLLADTVLHRQIELGLVQQEQSAPGNSIVTNSYTEETTASKPFCQVWQTVLSNDLIKYTLEFDNSLDYAQSSVTLLNDGHNRVTRTSYDGVRMQWSGTTGLGSPFGSGYFELRFVDSPNDRNANALENLTPSQQQQRIRRRPPVAVYHNVGSKSLAATRKVGEFVIWEPAFEYADILVTMAMVLREQEQRKEIEMHRVATNKLANF